MAIVGCEPSAGHEKMTGRGRADPADNIGGDDGGDKTQFCFTEGKQEIWVCKSEVTDGNETQAASEGMPGDLPDNKLGGGVKGIIHVLESLTIPDVVLH